MKADWRTEELNETQSLNFLDTEGFKSYITFKCDESLNDLETSITFFNIDEKSARNSTLYHNWSFSDA